MLTDRKIRAEKPGPNRTMLWDQRGLYLLCTPNGSKLWRFKCHIGPRGQRREKLLALGAYPEVSLAVARQRQAEAREIIRQGGDPLAEKNAQVVDNIGVRILRGPEHELIVFEDVDKAGIALDERAGEVDDAIEYGVQRI